MRSEPVAIIAAARAVLYAAVTLGLDLSDVQMVAIIGAVEAVLALVTRARVSPVE